MSTVCVEVTVTGGGHFLKEGLIGLVDLGGGSFLVEVGGGGGVLEEVGGGGGVAVDTGIPGADDTGSTTWALMRTVQKMSERTKRRRILKIFQFNGAVRWGSNRMSRTSVGD
jgi:hypothetical protein